MTLPRMLASYVDLIELTCFVAWVVLLLPALVFLGTTWPNRRNFLLARLGKDAIELYYEQFFPSTVRKRLGKRAAKKREAQDIEVRFRHDFSRLYGRRHYLLPLFLLALLAGIGMIATSDSIQVWLGWEPAARAYPKIAISAFLGAYAWVLYDQFERFRNGDFTAHDVYAGIYRFLIAIPLGISFASLLPEKVQVGMAFLLAAFPTTTLLKLMRRLVAKYLGVGEEEKGGPLELEKLQCVGRTNAERYLNEGISTIAELAWTNPIDLTIRTNRDFNFVIDSISQALLWVYFEDRVKELYPLSLRGAQEVCTLFEDLASTKRKAREAAEDSVKTAAAKMGIERESFVYTLVAVRDDPYTQFLYKIWT
jgi:hypothetical protein